MGSRTPRTPAERRGIERMEWKEFKCIVCDQTEERCICPKYCALCQSDYGPRLCEDGQYYCVDCREACDYKTQDEAH
jgi:hypothetical protein